MPPSPALRYSPRREVKVDSHKRGRSLEGGLLFKEDDEDDLALFNEMQSKERDNFLLQSTDDFEDTFATKLRHFSDVKLGISVPARGESSELLNADGEKNDYDWLLTPPDTPLFPSLDDEPPVVNMASRGRPRSQPITISRSSTMEKSYRSSRGSASPNRLSPSPRSGSSSLQSRGRPSSASHSSPTRNQRATTPSRLPSPPPSKAMTTARRSATPTPRRMSTGSGARGTSPIRTSRGNSASPKIRAWQSNIPGFSSEAPPNLRTSLGDRPASFVRGSSPASRNRDSAGKFSRQSMSPTATRSVSSSYSQDKDRASSHSKGSVASSGDDDVDSLQSIHVGSLDRLASKKVGLFPNNRAPAFSKKSTRVMTPSSAPKRSFNSALQQMDQRKSPQNMFRPLLSSVPSTSFYAGKQGSAYRSPMSRNSPITASSNAGYDQDTRDALDLEGRDHHLDDTTIDSEHRYADIHEEVFSFDKGELLNNVGESKSGISEEFSQQDDGIEISSASNNLCVTGEDFSEVDSLENTWICSACGCRYPFRDIVEKEINLCPDCRKLNNNAVNILETVTAEGSSMPCEKSKPSDGLGTSAIVLDSQVKLANTIEARYSPESNEPGIASYHENHNDFQESCTNCSEVERDEQMLIRQQGTGEPTVSDGMNHGESGGQQISLAKDHSNLKVDVSEGAGISLLLKNSSSFKGPFVQGRAFVASNVTYDDLSYARESANTLRSSIGHSSTSASSSVDFSSSRQVETRVHRQSSGRRSISESVRPQSSGSSGTHCRTHSSFTTSILDDHTDLSVGNMKYGAEELVASHSNIVPSGNKETHAFDVSSSDVEVLQQNSSKLSFQTQENLVASAPNDEDTLYQEGEDLRNNFDVSGVDTRAVYSDVPVEVEDAVTAARLDVLDVAEDPAHTSLVSETDMAADKHCQITLKCENDDTPTNSKCMNDFQESSVAIPEKDLAGSNWDYPADHIQDILEESTVMVECRGGSTTRSLTLEEATDAILFCSSIVQDLAYKAATIAIEKESPSPTELEGYWPTVTVPEKPSTARKDTRARNSTTKRKARKTRQKSKETDAEVLSSETENNENTNESGMNIVGHPNKMDSVKAPPKLESKCNCTIM